jgi:tubulin polyglutamylase TTLL11
MGVGNSNKNCFQIFGIDILIDEAGKPWLMEINANPSLNMFVTRQNEDDSVESPRKILSKLDKEVKTRVLRDTFRIIRGEHGTGSSFELIFETDDDPMKLSRRPMDDYSVFRALNEARILFELIAGYKKPEYLNIFQFNKLSHFPNMRNAEITKPSYDIVFTKFAKKADGTLLKLDHFYNAVEYLAQKLFPRLKPEESFSRLVANIMEHLT